MNEPFFSTLNLGTSTSSGSSSSLPFRLLDMPNPHNYSFFGSSDPYTYWTSHNNYMDRITSENAAAQEGLQSTSIDNSRSEMTIPTGEEIGEDLIPEEIEGEVISSAETGPLGLALFANQAIGQATASTMEAAQRDVVAQDYSSNMSQHGLNVGLNAGLVKANQEASVQSQASGAFAGSMFGPIGALIGHAVGGVVAANPAMFQTASSFQGAINPSDTGIVASQTTNATTGISDMTDDVTGTDSS